MINIIDFLKLMKDAEVNTETSCDTIRTFIRTDNYKIHLNNKVYTSIDDLPYKNVNVYSWEFYHYFSGEAILDIWCKR